MWLDIAAPALALGQAIGRWGNLYQPGAVRSAHQPALEIFIEPKNRLPGYQDQAYYHPLFLYESLGSFAIVILLLWISRRKADWLKTGDIFLVYLIVVPHVAFLTGVHPPGRCPGGRSQCQPDLYGGSRYCRSCNPGATPDIRGRQNRSKNKI